MHNYFTLSVIDIFTGRQRQNQCTLALTVTGHKFSKYLFLPQMSLPSKMSWTDSLSYRVVTGHSVSSALVSNTYLYAIMLYRTAWNWCVILCCQNALQKAPNSVLKLKLQKHCSRVWLSRKIY